MSAASFFDELFGLGNVNAVERALVQGAVQAAQQDRTRTTDQKAALISQLFHVPEKFVRALLG